ncbi:MAG: AI-2E family transporter, partial [Clostridiaceae bacterium]|nr:AI-2E family transporter [Clostridiaceae bacterium]
MKMKIDTELMKYAIYASFTIVLSIISYQILDNMGYLVGSFSDSLSWIRKILSPFIMAAFIAYILNPGVRWFEKKLYSNIQYVSQRKKLHRVLSILTVYLILIGLISMLIMFVAPQISNNINEIIKRVPEYINISSKMIEEWANEVELVNIYNFAEYIEKNIREVFNTTGQVLDYVLNNIVVNIMTVTSGVLNFVLALIISFYLLADKESFKIGGERILRAVIQEEKVDRLKDFGREADELFGKFIIGKSLDSFIIGVICLVGLIILDIRYALLISVIVGITNMIPYFGPFIGGVPATIITFFDSPIKALWVILFILALQQFDGLFLGPKILGDSVGLKPFWIIFAIVVGG